MQIKLQGFFQYELCLGHSALEGIYQKDNAVHHFQDTLHFTAEICMARRIYDIDLCILIVYSCIFRKYRDTALAFNIIGVHDTLLDFLVFAEDTALFQ